MKNRQAAILTGMFLCMAAVTGCGSNTETQAAKQQGSEIEDTAAENTAAEGDDEKTDGKTGKTEEQKKKIRFSVRLFRYLRTPLQFL